MSFFSKQSIGIDISDRSVEIVCVDKRSGGVHILSSERVELSPGLVEAGVIQNETELRTIVRTALTKAGVKKIEERSVTFGLPARFTYVRTVEAPKKKSEYETVVETDLSHSIPLSKENRLVVFKPILDQAKKNWLFIMVADRLAVSAWHDFLISCGLKQVQFAAELLATGAGLKDQSHTEPFCLLDLGADTTKIGFFVENKLRLAAVNNLGGDAITASIIETCVKDPVIAEKEKCQYGLAGRSHVSSVVRSYIDHLAVVIGEEISFAEGVLKTAFKQVIMVGGTSQIKGLAEYLTEKFGRAVVYGEADTVVKGGGILFVEALGLGMIGLAPEDHMIFSYVAQEKAIKEQPKEFVSKPPIFISTNKAADKTLYDDPLLRRRIFLLSALACVSALIFVVSLWYKAEQDKKKALFIAAQPHFTQVTPIDIIVPVAVNKNEQTPDRVVGNLRYVRVTAGSVEEAIGFSKIEADKQLQTGEKLWSIPIEATSTGKIVGNNKQSVTDVVQKEYRVAWLSYDDAGANSYLTSKASAILLGNQISFGVNNIQKISVASSENPSVYNLLARLTVSTLDKISDNIVQSIK